MNQPSRSLRAFQIAAALAAAIVLAITLAACGSNKNNASGTTSTSGTTPTTSATPTSSTPTTAPAPKSYGATGPSYTEISTSKTVTVGGKSVKVPTDQGDAISPMLDNGQAIIISAAGFLPAKLYSNPSVAIVWTNLTNQPQQVIFDHFSVKSPVIPPGGTWSWTTANSESITYRSASGMNALVIVNPPGV